MICFGSEGWYIPNWYVICGVTWDAVPEQSWKLELSCGEPPPLYSTFQPSRSVLNGTLKYAEIHLYFSVLSAVLCQCGSDSDVGQQNLSESFDPLVKLFKLGKSVTGNLNADSDDYLISLSQAADSDVTVIDQHQVARHSLGRPGVC